MADRAETLPDGCEAHGIPAYADGAGTVHIATGARCIGPIEARTAPTCHHGFVLVDGAFHLGSNVRCIGPDPDREARVAARRAEDARKAGRALDGILSEHAAAVYRAGHGNGWAAGYRAAQDEFAASGLHQNRHYGAAVCSCKPHPIFGHEDGCRYEGMGAAVDPCAGGRCPDPAAHAEGAHDL